MLTSKFLKDIMTEARPIIERQLDDAELIAGLRDVFTAQGGDWGALKALIKSQVQDERDEAGEGKRIRKLRDRSGNQLAYADMLGLGNMNEENSFAEDEGFDPSTGEVTQTQAAPQPAQGSDEAAEPVASQPIQPETANHEGEAQKVERRSPKPEDAGSIPATFAIAGSSNGRTAEFDSVNAGSTPAPASNVSALRPAKQFRPLCLNRERCGASGPKECWKCLKAAEQGSAA